MVNSMIIQKSYILCNALVIIICKIHGEFLQTPTNHLRTEGCKKCPKTSSCKSNTKEFVQKATTKQDDEYDYSKVDYVGWNDKVIIGCKIHGDFLQTPGSWLSYLLWRSQIYPEAI